MTNPSSRNNSRRRDVAGAEDSDGYEGPTAKTGRAMTEAALDHALLQELVAALSDGELPWGEARVVRRHLRDCVPCQRELAVQKRLGSALAQEPARLASTALRQRIQRIGVRAPQPFALGWRAWLAPAAATGLVAFTVVCGAAFVAVGVGRAGALIADRDQAGRPSAAIPVLQDALADCRRAMTRNFPRKADLQAVGAGLHFPVRALERPDVELFSTWKTTLAGSPAAGLAYRWRGTILVQYAMPAEMLRRAPVIGAALREAAVFSTSEGGQGIVVSVANGRGTLFVAFAPAEELRRLIL